MPPPDAAERERRPQDRRDSRSRSTAASAFLQRAHDAAPRRGEADPHHRLGELRAVLGHADGALVGADQLDAVLLERAVRHQRHRHVERGLAAHRRAAARRGVRARSPSPPTRGSPARCRSRSASSGSVMIVAGLEFTRMTRYPSSLQRAHRLGAGVVELGALPDDDRAGADEENRGDVSALGHVRGPARCGQGRSGQPTRWWCAAGSDPRSGSARSAARSSAASCTGRAVVAGQPGQHRRSNRRGDARCRWRRCRPHRGHPSSSSAR